MLSIQTIILSLILLIVFPGCTGYGFCKKLDLSQSIYSWYLFGCVFLWGAMELILVPMIYFKAPFTWACALVLMVNVLGTCHGISAYRKSNPGSLNPVRRIRARKKRTLRFEYVLLAITGIITLAAASVYVFFQFQTLSDNHYITSATDMIRSDRFFLSSNATGKVLNSIPSIYSTELASPWTFTYAFLSWFASTSPLIAAHVILPLQLLLACSCCYLTLSEIFFFKNNLYRIIFIVLVWTIQLLGYYSGFTTEAHLMTRIWQGPALVSCLGIPVMLTVFLQLFSRPFYWKSWLVLCFSNLALCFMDRSGVILGLMMILAFCLIYACLHKNTIILACGAAICLSNIKYWVLADSILNGIHYKGRPSPAFILEKMSDLFLGYYGNTFMVILAVSCAIMLYIISAKESRRFLYPFLAIITMTIYPVICMMAMAGLKKWTIFWLFPEYIIISLTLTKFIEKTYRKSSKLAGLIFISFLMLICGYYTFNFADISQTANLEKINDGHKEIYDYILSRDAEPSCIMDDSLLYEARQYSADFVLPYSLKEDGSIDMIDLPYYTIPNLLEYPLRGSFKLVSIARDNGFNYIIIKADHHMRVKTLLSSKFILLNRIGNYLIYYRHTPEEYKLFRQNMDKLNTNFTRVFRIVKKFNEKQLKDLIESSLSDEENQSNDREEEAGEETLSNEEAGPGLQDNSGDTDNNEEDSSRMTDYNGEEDTSGQID